MKGGKKGGKKEREEKTRKEEEELIKPQSAQIFTMEFVFTPVRDIALQLVAGVWNYRLAALLLVNYSGKDTKEILL